MYRRKTVEALLRQNARERDQLLQVIAVQNDRIMHLAGQSWTPPPAAALRVVEDDTPDPYVYDADQLIHTEA